MSLSFVTQSNAGARLTEVANTAANGDQAGVRYTLALDDQRTEAVEESGAKWQYGYDGLKQLVTAKKTDTQATVIPPLDQSYAYDPMGNRRTYADQTGSTAYTANNANQYTAVGGVASVYDHNGNLLTDGVKNYTWDAENQLTSVTPVNPTEGSAKVEYTYDWRMRRTGKKSYTYANGDWALTKTTGFKYHEWNPIQENITPASGSTGNKYYVWGNDLSGNLHGAGGVGGLLSMKYNGENYFYAFDGNGNVRALVKADAANPVASSIVERYSYDGFGREIPSSFASPPSSGLNSFQFSTKYLETETGMNYYGYRFYAADTGRWINRDPVVEFGGINLYSMLGNCAVIAWDVNGLSSCTELPCKYNMSDMKTKEFAESQLNKSKSTLRLGPAITIDNYTIGFSYVIETEEKDAKCDSGTITTSGCSRGIFWGLGICECTCTATQKFKCTVTEAKTTKKIIGIAVTQPVKEGNTVITIGGINWEASVSNSSRTVPRDYTHTASYNCRTGALVE